MLLKKGDFDMHKRNLLCLLALLLALALPLGALAEADAGWSELPAEEIDFDLGETDIAAPEEPAEPISPQAPEAIEPEPPTGEQTEHWLGAPLEAKKLVVRKDVSKTVYMGLPYVICVKEGIKRVRTSDSAVASATKAGVVTLSAPGTAKLTVTLKTGGRRKLTLKVKEAPAPRKAKLTAENDGFRLSWGAAKYATGYLVQISREGGDWEDVATTRALFLDVTDAVLGESAFRVVAILGDALGGASEALSVLNPVEDVAVVCEEKFYYGPTDRLNVTWSPSVGATGYEVYRAELPEGEYERLGATEKTWYADTRDPLKLYAYRVRPVFRDLHLPLSAPVNLWTGYADNVLPPKDLDSDSGVILVVNKMAQVVTAYIKDAKGRYTLPLRHMICSTGRSYDRTKNGTYRLTSRKGEWYTYPGPSGDTIRWPSVYRSGYYFHSPLYNRDHSIRGGAVRALGKRASAGCIRLKVRDAEWVYRNCVNGTTVYICDGKTIAALNKALLPRDVEVSGF